MTFAEGKRRAEGEDYSGEELFEGSGSLKSGNETVEDVFTQAKTQLEEELRGLAEGGRFNPNPNEEDVRQLRNGYARLLQEARSYKNDLIRPESTRLQDMLSDANELMNRVHTTIDATLDSRFVAISADLGAEKVNKLAMGTVDFSVSDFSQLMKAALVRSMGAVKMMGEEEEPTADDTSEEYDWKVIGEMVTRHWRGVVTSDYMLGPIAVERREKRPRTRVQRERKQIDPVVQPSVLDVKDRNNPGGASETAEKVLQVYQLLEALGHPVPFYQFITHPTSYSKTVENLFYISFLANDNRIQLEEGTSQDDLMIRIIEEEDNDEDIIKPKHQQIYSMTMALWRQMIKKYKLKRPMIDL